MPAHDRHQMLTEVTGDVTIKQVIRVTGPPDSPHHGRPRGMSELPFRIASGISLRQFVSIWDLIPPGMVLSAVLMVASFSNPG